MNCSHLWVTTPWMQALATSAGLPCARMHMACASAHAKPGRQPAHTGSPRPEVPPMLKIGATAIMFKSRSFTQVVAHRGPSAAWYASGVATPMVQRLSGRVSAGMAAYLGFAAIAVVVEVGAAEAATATGSIRDFIILEI